MRNMLLSKACEKCFFYFMYYYLLFLLNLKMSCVLDFIFSNLQRDGLPDLKNKKAALYFAKGQHSKKKANTII